MKLLLSDAKNRFEKIKLGGGKKSIEKQKEKNKLTARERIDYLTDKKKPFIEIGRFAGFEMYEEQGGCPAGGAAGVRSTLARWRSHMAVTFFGGSCCGASRSGL